MMSDQTPSLSRLPRAIDYPLSDEQRAVQAHVRRFAEESLEPIAAAVDASDEHSDELVALLRASGVFAHFVPREFGGAGLSVTNVCLVREELARVCVKADEIYASQGLAIQCVVRWGDDEMRRKYLGGLLEGTHLFAFCLTEPIAGSDVGGIATTATERGDEFLLNGTKRFIYAPEHCTTLIVFAKTDPEAGKRGISAFVLDRPDHGIEIEPFLLLSPSPHTEMTFTDCPVPARNMIGPRGAGVKVALSNLDRLRPAVGAAAVGMAERALDAAIRYTQERRAFGGTISDFQTVRFRIAAAAAELDAARLLVYAAAANADGAEIDVAAASAKAKLVATETAQRVIDTAVQLHGGVGLYRGSLTERFFKAIRATRIYEGSSEVMQLVISRALFTGAKPSGR